MATRVWVVIGSINGLISVLAGAYGRHGALDAGGREMFAIASQYQMTHALALLAVAWLTSRSAGEKQWPIVLSGSAFALGTLLFSGSLYWFGVTGLVPFEGMAPAGGWLMIIGWVGMIISAVHGMTRNTKNSERDDHNG